VLIGHGNVALFDGRLDDAAASYHRARMDEASGPGSRLVAHCCEALALGYAADPRASATIDELLAAVDGSRSPCAAYAWYAAGEAELDHDVATARQRYERAIELAAASGASFVTGAAGASKASLEPRHADPTVAAAEYARLLDHWRRAGMWSTQWTMLRSVAVLLDVLGRHRDAAVLAGAVMATSSGHRIFGADEVALAGLVARLRAALGDAAYEEAVAAGAVLDDDAAVEHALRSL
jgi:hypothetical protein